MATTPGIGLQFQPNQALQGFPQQAIGLNQIGQQQRKQQQIMQLNQMPGMVEDGIYTDNGIMALSQIDPGMRDEAVQKRATILNMKSQERYRKAQEDKIRDAERTEMLTDVMSNVYSAYSGTPGSEEARKQALATKLNEEVEAMIKDGRAAKYGMTPEQIAQFRSHTSPDDILVKLLKHRPKEAEFYQAREGARAIAGEGGAPAAPVTGGDAGGATPQTVSLADVGTDGAEVKPNEPTTISGVPLDDRPPMEDEAEFERIAKQWEDYEGQLKDAFLSGTMDVNEYEKALVKVDEEKARTKKYREMWAEKKKPQPTGMEAPDVPIVKKEPDDLIAKARDAEAKAKKLRATGMPANIKQAEAYDKQAKKYRDQAQREIGFEQKERALDQADKRIQIAIDRAKATQSALPEEAVNFVADQIIRGNAQAGAGLARNQVAKAQIITAYTKLAKERGMSPGDVNAAMNEFQGLQQASRTLGARSANIDVAAEELAQFILPAEKASAAVPRTNFVPINRLIQLGEAQWSPEQAAFVAANRSVINAFAGLASRGVPTVHGTEEAEKMLSTAQTHEQYKAVLKQLWTEAQAAIEATKNVRKHVREAVTGEPSKPQPYPGSPAGAPAVPRETPKAAAPAPMFARNPKTGERIQSNDGGKTWQPAK